MDRVTRHPLLKDIPFETAVDYAIEFIRILGTPPAFLEKTQEIEINNYRGELPCDFYEMIQVRQRREDNKLKRDTVFRYTTDSFHMSPNKGNGGIDYTYKIQGNCIFTSPLQDGKIEIAYMAMPIDDEGYPLIPDNSAFSRALELYIKKQWMAIQFDLGKVNPQIMARIDLDYAWAVGLAQTDLIRPTVDQMQAITNMWNTLIPRYYEHNRGFVNSGSEEHLRIH